MDPNLKSILSRVDRILTNEKEEEPKIKVKMPTVLNDADLIEDLKEIVKDTWMLRSIGYDDFVGQCKNCFEYEEHHPGCVIRVIEAWLEEVS